MTENKSTAPSVLSRRALLVNGAALAAAAALPRFVPPPVTIAALPASASSANTRDPANRYSPITLITRRFGLPPSNSQ